MRSASNALKFVRAAFDDQKRPVLIYQMGKVGSTAVLHALRREGSLAPFHVHRINRRNIAWHYPKEPGCYFSWVLPVVGAVPVVTLIREPLGRNVSAWFENFPARQFDERFVECYPHRVPIEWFDRELAVSLDVDVYAVRFDHDRGWIRIDHPKHPTLVMKSRLSDVEKSKALNVHLGVDVQVERAKVGADRAYGHVYRTAKEQFRYPPDLAESLLESRYARHFFTNEELDDAWNRWVV